MIDVPKDDIITMLEAGYIYLAMKRFKEAKKLFEGVCELAPKHDVPQVAVANVYFAQSKFLEATRVLKAAIKDNPDSAHAWAHLGEAQLFYGKKDDALESLKKASELMPEGEGNPGHFARSLLDLIAAGYDPVEQKKAFKKSLKENPPEKVQKELST